MISLWLMLLLLVLMMMIMDLILLLCIFTGENVVVLTKIEPITFCDLGKLT